MWIKICGITSLEDAELAIVAGADALGFVFAESPRRVQPETVRDIVGKLSKPVETIGVFVDASSDEITAICQLTGLSGAQLHHSNSATKFPDVRAGRDVSPQFRLLRVVRHDGDNDRFALELRRMHLDTASRTEQDAILVDSCVRGKQGGTGHVFDWAAARASFLEEAPHLRLIAAGGLRPENVAEAIQILRPWGVDVSSGVEAGPGKKDSARVTDFIRAARAAAGKTW
ncbi:MAG TPA: phosphoribosylanthranilate isomerase [Acidobacteriaceae bacterium]|nr:phosphoribosylanthranilate isomerase [Acidobacteriaceae bacterium]